MSAVLPSSPLLIDVSAAAEKARPQRVGMLIIGRKRAGFDQEWNQLMRQRACAAMEEMSLAWAGAAEPVIDDQTTIAALEQIIDARCDALLVLQPSLGNGQLAFTVMQHWHKPIVLWATPERQEGQVVSSCSLVAQHLWASLLRQSNHPFEFVYGDPNDAQTRRSLQRAIAVTQIPAVLQRTKIGLIGSQAPGFVAMHADPFLLKQTLGVQLHNLSLTMFIERVQGIESSRVRDDVEQARGLDLPHDGDISDDDYAVNSRYYLAMRDLIAEENLDALALQCWPELSNLVGHWPYLALTRLNDEGFVASMEGDVDGALTCLMGKLLGAGVGFITDWLEHDAQTIHFWHPGVAPLPLCEDGAATLARHFNIPRPMVVDGALRVGMDVTIARLWRCDGAYRLATFEGKTIPPRRKLTGNTALVQVDGFDVRDWFDDALHAGMPHHVVLFQGHHRDSLARTARLLKINLEGRASHA